MKEQEAIVILKSEGCVDCNGTDDSAIRCKNKNCEVRIAVEMAITALEKQEGKKPVEFEDKYYGCPACGNVLMHKWVKYPTQLRDKTDGLSYCLSCGQKLDWSGEE